MSRKRTLYGVVLEISDEPVKDLVTVKLQSSLYGPEHPRSFLNAYISVLKIVPSKTAVRVDEVKVVF